MCGVDDIDACTFAGYLTNEHGFDPISFGVTLSAAMELYEMGVITKEETDGVELKFGNAEALTIMAEKTGKYEGFGQILGMGSMTRLPWAKQNLARHRKIRRPQ